MSLEYHIPETERESSSDGSSSATGVGSLDAFRPGTVDLANLFKVVFLLLPDLLELRSFRVCPVLEAESESDIATSW